jgi:hypothetical protein
MKKFPFDQHSFYDLCRTLTADNLTSMKNAHLDEVLFDKFLAMLESKGIKPQGGTLVAVTSVKRVAGICFRLYWFMQSKQYSLLATRCSPLLPKRHLRCCC